ncbi:MAG: phosphate ABC transporter permease PstA [Acidiferrobacterales bacterium]|nr:phosphate ABC transporter permease PstA [Acidiferrobacterales bacterium]
MNSVEAQQSKVVWESPHFRKRLKRRNSAEVRFKCYGLGAVILGVIFVFSLFASIAVNGISSFWQTQIQLEVHFDSGDIDANDLRGGNYGKLIKQAMYKQFPDVTKRKQKRELSRIVSIGASFILQRLVADDPSLLGTTKTLWVPVDDEFDMLFKHDIGRDGRSRLSKNQIDWFDQLVDRGLIQSRFNKLFLTAGDSREPELAGLRGALTGSFLMILVTLLISFPVGAAGAVYLQEFAPRNRFTDIIEININNLAAVPSVVFGLLGLAVFINFFGMPRSVPLVGGLVLSLMTIPTIIIAGRAALRAIPPSIREGSLALGASKTQTVIQEVVPLAMPGFLTGTIIGLAQALGETAPLLMIGMVAFIVDIPGGLLDPSTALPVQIYLWADSPERAFLEKTSGAILILLGFLFTMNVVAVILRRKFERKW